MPFDFDSVSLPRFDEPRWRHLSSARKVVLVLMQKGDPPVPFRVSHTVRDVVDCIAALGCHTRLFPSDASTAVTPQFWHNHLAPWLTSLLLTTLSLHRITSTEINMTQLRADVLMYVPFCLDASNIPFQFTQDPRPNSFAVSSQLQYLLFKGWLTVLREGIVASTTEGLVASTRWSSFLLEMKRNCHEEDLFDVRTLKIFQPDDAPFLLGYLHTLVLSAARGDLSPFEHPSSLHLLTDVVLQSAHNGDPTGFVRAVAKSTPGPILIRVLTKTLLIRRSFTACGSRDIGDINLPVRRCAIEAFISSSIVILITLFDDPGVVADVLETGLLSSLLKRPSCLVNLPINIEQNLGSLFDVINQSMVFSAVFRAFVRAQKRGGSRYARHINNAPSSLVEKWESLEEKVRFIDAIRVELKTCGLLYRCAATGCTSTRVARYKRCARCGTTYCSQACQRKDWKVGHRARCSSSDQSSNRAIDDIFFLPRVSEAYLADNALEIQVMIDSYVDSLPRGEDDNLGTLDPAYLDPAYLSDFRLVRTGEKNPIMIHNLTLPGIPAPSRCMRPVFTASAATIPMNDCDCSGLLTAWRRFSNRLFVVVIPPNIKRRKSAFYVNIPWPPRRE